MLKVYGAKINNEVDKKLYEKALSYIPENKQKRIKRFLKYEDSLRTLIAEVLIRKIIMQELKIPNGEIFFKINNYGKPYLKDWDEFHFNISHSGKWVVCAISNKPVGIDVERIKDLNIKIADRFFSKEEVEDLYKIKKSERLKYFFDLWTLKESYIKADGRGMFLPLNSFSFGIKDNIITFKTENKLRDCFFKIYTIADQYKISVCTLEDTFPQTVTIKNFYDIIELFLGSK